MSCVARDLNAAIDKNYEQNTILPCVLKYLHRVLLLDPFSDTFFWRHDTAACFQSSIAKVLPLQAWLASIV